MTNQKEHIFLDLALTINDIVNTKQSLTMIPNLL